MIATPSNDTRCGYPIEFINDVTGTAKRIYTKQTRGQIVENLLWSARRSTSGKCKREPFDVCVHVFPDRIVMRFHCPAWKDQKRARRAIQALIDDTGGVE